MYIVGSYLIIMGWPWWGYGIYSLGKQKQNYNGTFDRVEYWNNVKIEEILNFQEINSINFLNKNHLWLSYVIESQMLLGKNNFYCISWRILMRSIFPKWKAWEKKTWMRIFGRILVQIGIWCLDRKGLEHKFLQPFLSDMFTKYWGTSKKACFYYIYVLAENSMGQLSLNIIIMWL